MPVQVQGPDGQMFEFPDGTPRETMKAAMQKRYGAPAQHAAPKADFSGVTTSVDSGPAPSYGEQRLKEIKDFGNGIRYNVADAALGLGQMVASGADMIAPRERTTADLVSGRDPSRRAEIDALQRTFKANQAAQAAQGGEFFSGGDLVGSAVQTAAPIGKVATTGKAAYGLAALAGGAYGATRSVGEGESRLQNTALGAGFGVLGQGVAQGLGGLAKLAPQATRDVFKAAEDRGVKLTYAQMHDSEFVKRLASLSDKLPFSGATKRVAAQTEAVNKGVAKEIGAKVNSDGVIDAGVMADRYAKFNKQFDSVFASGTTMDNKFLTQVGQTWKFANENLDDSAKNTVNRVVERLQDQGVNGRISGETLKSLDQDLRKLATGGGDRQHVATELRNALHENFGRNAGPGQKEAWDTLRKQYANYKKIEPVISRNHEGPLPPTQLRGALAADKAGKARVARGAAGEMGDLAMIGQRMKGPNTSGTPEGMQSAAVGYGLMNNPISALGLLATGNVGGRALNSNLLARLAMSEGRGNIAPLATAARPLPLFLSGPAYANGPERP